MKEPRPLIVRLFSWIWILIVFCFRAIVVLSLLFIGIGIWAGSRNQTPAIENNIALAVIPTGEISDQVVDDQSRAFVRQFSGLRGPVDELVGGGAHESYDAAGRDVTGEAHGAGGLVDGEQRAHRDRSVFVGAHREGKEQAAAGQFRRSACRMEHRAW